MEFKNKINAAGAYADCNNGELAERLGTSSSAFCQRLSTGKFKLDELEKIAEALGAKFECAFVFPDGTKI